MATNLTPAQIERLRLEKIQRFKKLGLPEGAGQMMDVPVENVPVIKQHIQETVVETIEAPTQNGTINYEGSSINENEIRKQIEEERNLSNSLRYIAPRDKFAALQAIKSGAKKNEFKTFIKAENFSTNINQIPEPRQRKSSSSVKIEPKSFNVVKSAEAENIERLFTDDSKISLSSNIMKGNLVETDEDYSNIGPSYNPVEHLRKKLSSKDAQLLNETKTPLENSVNRQLQNEIGFDKMMIMMENMLNIQQKKQNELEQLKEEIINIAKKTTQDTMLKVIKEYAENQKKKNVYEVIDKNLNVVKIGDRYFKLQPVKIKTNHQ